MSLPLSIKELRVRYQRGENLLQLLRESKADPGNSSAAVLASYDIQAGSYTQAMEHPAHHAGMRRYAAAIANLIDELGASSVLEVGVGEATTLAHVVSQMASAPASAAGFDISWSRVAHGRRYAAREGVDLSLVVGDLFAIPAADDSFDVVYTSHSIEPNRGREREALAELHRVARRYVVLLEPASRLGNAATQARIREHGYCSDLDEHARALGFTVTRHSLFDVCLSDTNQTELIVIAKEGQAERAPAGAGWPACPRCHTPLVAAKGHLYCEECALIYPVVDGIPCLLSSAAILSSQFADL